MKSNNKFNFVKSFKYWMITPIVLLLVAIVFSAVFGLNLDYDFRTVSSFDVKLISLFGFSFVLYLLDYGRCKKVSRFFKKFRFVEVTPWHTDGFSTVAFMI